MSHAYQWSGGGAGGALDGDDSLVGSMRRIWAYLDGRDIEIIAGDIEGTCRRLEGESLVLAFIDNHTPAAAALEVVRERTVAGGAIPSPSGPARKPGPFGRSRAGRSAPGLPVVPQGGNTSLVGGGSW